MVANLGCVRLRETFRLIKGCYLLRPRKSPYCACDLRNAGVGYFFHASDTHSGQWSEATAEVSTALGDDGRFGQSAAEDVVDADGGLVGREGHPRGVRKEPECAAQPVEHASATFMC